VTVWYIPGSILLQVKNTSVKYSVCPDLVFGFSNSQSDSEFELLRIARCLCCAHMRLSIS
jgi:hypothetical protein